MGIYCFVLFDAPLKILGDTFSLSGVCVHLCLFTNVSTHWKNSPRYLIILESQYNEYFKWMFKLYRLKYYLVKVTVVSLQSVFACFILKIQLCENNVQSILDWLVGWLFGFYGILTLIGYLMPNLFLYK